MELKEVKISEIKNLNLIYIFTTDNIIKDNNKYIATKVVYNNNETMFLDYKDPYFEKFIRRIIDRYNKEKDSRNIILLGDLTKQIILDDSFSSIGEIPSKKIEGISIFDTNNFKLKKYESYLKDTLVNILKTIKGYESVNITKIDGYNNKFVVYYSVGSVELELRLIVSFRDDNHIDFKIRHIDGMDINLEGTIENNINNVNIYWNSKTNDLNGYNKYDVLNGIVEKSIKSGDESIYYSEESDTLLDSDIELIKFYTSLFNINILNNIIKTNDNNYILGSEEVINDIDSDIFFKNNGIQITIDKDLVIVRYKELNGLSKYNNQVNVELSSNMIEGTLSKINIDKDNYVLVEVKNTNDFGSTYNYYVYKVDNIDFRNIFNSDKKIELSNEVDSLYDIECYVKKLEGDKK